MKLNFGTLVYIQCRMDLNVQMIALADHIFELVQCTMPLAAHLMFFAADTTAFFDHFVKMMLSKMVLVGYKIAQLMYKFAQVDHMTVEMVQNKFAQVDHKLSELVPDKLAQVGRMIQTVGQNKLTQSAHLIYELVLNMLAQIGHMISALAPNMLASVGHMTFAQGQHILAQAVHMPLILFVRSQRIHTNLSEEHCILALCSCILVGHSYHKCYLHFHMHLLVALYLF